MNIITEIYNRNSSKWIDISNHAKTDGFGLKEAGVNTAGKSIINTADFELKKVYTQLNNYDNRNLYDIISKDDDILVRLSDNDIKYNKELNFDIQGFSVIASYTQSTNTDNIIVSVSITGGTVNGEQYPNDTKEIEINKNNFPYTTVYINTKTKEYFIEETTLEDVFLNFGVEKIYLVVIRYYTTSNKIGLVYVNNSTIIVQDLIASLVFSGTIRKKLDFTLKRDATLDTIKVSATSLLYWLEHKSLSNFYPIKGLESSDTEVYTIDKTLALLFDNTKNNVLKETRLIEYQPNGDTQEVTPLIIKTDEIVMEKVQGWLTQYGYYLDVMPDGKAIARKFIGDTATPIIIDENGDVRSDIDISINENKYGVVEYNYATQLSSTSNQTKTTTIIGSIDVHSYTVFSENTVPVYGIFAKNETKRTLHYMLGLNDDTLITRARLKNYKLYLYNTHLTVSLIFLEILKDENNNYKTRIYSQYDSYTEYNYLVTDMNDITYTFASLLVQQTETIKYDLKIEKTLYDYKISIKIIESSQNLLTSIDASKSQSVYEYEYDYITVDRNNKKAVIIDYGNYNNKKTMDFENLLNANDIPEIITQLFQNFNRTLEFSSTSNYEIGKRYSLYINRNDTTYTLLCNEKEFRFSGVGDTVYKYSFYMI